MISLKVMRVVVLPLIITAFMYLWNFNTNASMIYLIVEMSQMFYSNALASNSMKNRSIGGKCLRG